MFDVNLEEIPSGSSAKLHRQPPQQHVSRCDVVNLCFFFFVPVVAAAVVGIDSSREKMLVGNEHR